MSKMSNFLYFYWFLDGYISLFLVVVYFSKKTVLFSVLTYFCFCVFNKTEKEKHKSDKRKNEKIIKKNEKSAE